MVSLPTPRGDSKLTNIKVHLASLALKEKVSKMKGVYYCDNSNLGSINGNPIMRHFQRNDKVHLASSGISIFASNLRYAINYALEIQPSDHDYYDFNIPSYNRGFNGYYSDRRPIRY